MLRPAVDVGRGAWAIDIPLPAGAPETSTVYALEVPDGVVLVDAGWKSDSAWAALTAGLESFGAQVEDVVGILITHVHPDHYGLAPRIASMGRAWTAMHVAEARLLAEIYRDPDALVVPGERWLGNVGVPVGERAALREAGPDMRPVGTHEPPEFLLMHDDVVELGHWRLRVLHTRGHSPGHACYVAEGQRMLFSGDHVLPSITPIVSTHLRAGRDPMGAYLQSLDLVASVNVDRVLPGHGSIFTDLPGRVETLRTQLLERAAEVLACVTRRSMTAYQVAERVRWRRPWTELGPFERRLAVGEVHAHLERLRAASRIAPASHDSPRWGLAAALDNPVETE